MTDPQAKLRAMDAFIDRFYPGRTAALRPPTEQEIKAITILGMEIEDAAAKIRSTGVADEEEDYASPFGAPCCRCERFSASRRNARASCRASRPTLAE